MNDSKQSLASLKDLEEYEIRFIVPEDSWFSPGLAYVVKWNTLYKQR